MDGVGIQQSHLGALLKHILMGPTIKFSDLVDLRMGPKNLNFNKFPGAAAAFLVNHTCKFSKLGTNY